MISVLQKTFLVLETLGRSKEAVPLRTLFDVVNLPKPTLYRILKSLVNLGYVSQEQGTSFYRLTGRLAQLGQLHSGETLKQRVLPLMEKLHRQFNETINFAVLDGSQVRYLHAIETTRSLRLMSQPHAVDPFYSTALGRAIVAFLPPSEQAPLLNQIQFERRTAKTICDKKSLNRVLQETRTQGWAIDDEENDDGVICLGIPLLESDRPVGAISITLPKVRLTPSVRKSIIHALLKTHL